MGSSKVSRGAVKFELSQEAIRRIKIRAQKTFIRYYKWFIADAVSADDVEQELFLVAYETIDKYKTKNPDDIIKLVQHRITWKLHELVRNAKTTAIHFNTEDMSGDDKDNLMEELHDDTNHSDFLKLAYAYCTEKEYAILQYKFVEGKTFQEIAQIYKTSKQRMEFLYSKMLKKLQNKCGLEL